MVRIVVLLCKCSCSGWSWPPEAVPLSFLCSLKCRLLENVLLAAAGSTFFLHFLMIFDGCSMIFRWCFIDCFMIFLQFFLICFLIFSWFLLDFFMICSWCFHDFFINFSWFFNHLLMDFGTRSHPTPVGHVPTQLPTFFASSWFIDDVSSIFYWFFE